jgi:hypothetical protein
LFLKYYVDKFPYAGHHGVIVIVSECPIKIYSGFLIKIKRIAR